MKKYIISVFIVFYFFQSFGQFKIKEGIYKSFDGHSFNVFIIEGKYTVLKIDTTYISADQLKDTLILSRIVERIDSYYTSYKNFCGKEPSGGDSEYGYKSSVAFASPSCGAACGLVGGKGIEASPGMFLQIFNETKYRVNTNRVGIVGYEFGRNFFTMGGKLLFPYTPGTDEKNGGLAEGFATVGGLIADLDYLTKQDSSLAIFQETLYFYQQLKRHFLAYLNDLHANPYNSMAKDYQFNDINRNTWNFGNPSSSILVGINEIFKKETLFSQFFKYLGDRKNASSIEEALGNIAYCFSKSLNYNLLPFFQNVLKFKIDQTTANSIKLLPLAGDKLIHDQQELWFTTPFDTIPLNIRSINYLNQKNYYQLFVDDSLVSETTDGNNLLYYSLLKNKTSTQLTVKLLDSNKKLIDSQKIMLSKRTDIDLSKYYKDFTFFDTQGYCKPGFVNGAFIINNFSNKIAGPGLEMPFPLKRNRTIFVTGQIRNQRIEYPNMIDSVGNFKVDSYSYLAIGGGGGLAGSSRVGYDIARDDTTNYYKVNFSINTNDFFGADWAVNLDFITQKFYIFTTGINKGYFKNIIYKDITDTDNDGVIDFEDPCPDEYGIFGGCPQVKTTEHVGILTINSNSAKKVNAVYNQKDYISMVLDSAQDISEYLIDYSKDSLFISNVQTLKSTKNKFSFSIKDTGTYYFRSYAKSEYGQSEYSSKKEILITNTAPVANAGEDQTFRPCYPPVTLNGSGSYDLDGNSLSYKWTVLYNGSNVLRSNESQITTADINSTPGYHYFSLVVNDGLEDSPADTIKVVVYPIYIGAGAGKDQIVNEGSLVTLGGINSQFDPFSMFLVYKWTKPEGINLNETNALNPTFIAPEVKKDTTYSFILNVSLACESFISTTTVNILVKDVIKTGSEVSLKNGIEIFPNPTNGIFKIEGLQINGENRISIYSVDGKLIRNKIISSTNETIDISDQVSGTYLLYLNNQTYKIVKK